MLVTYFAAFYLSKAGDYVWHKKMKLRKGEGPLAKRMRYIRTIWSKNEYIFNVAVDGLVSMAVYKGADTLAENIPRPHWLLATPVYYREPTTSKS